MGKRIAVDSRMMKTNYWTSPLLTSSEYDQAKLYARSPWPILIQGETGVGKDFFARWVHDHSANKSGPYVPVNCGALPANLVESELFGFERGAFTGAQTSSLGLVRSAEQGTLFLDEIGELDLPAQTKLLRFLDTGEVRALNARKAQHAQVRVIAASHVDLLTAVKRGRFRLDLYERLSVLSLQIPPLRQKRAFITVIAENILRAQAFEWEPEALSLLTPYPWPGNIRQLRNVLLRAAILGNGRVARKGLGAVLAEHHWIWENTQTSQATGVSDGSKLWEIEQDVVRSRLRKFGGNKKATAEDLGIAKSTLHEMLRRWKDFDSTALDVDSSGECAPRVHVGESGDSAHLVP